MKQGREKEKLTVKHDKQKQDLVAEVSAVSENCFFICYIPSTGIGLWDPQASSI